MRLLPLVLLVGRAAGECVPGKWLECRDELRQALFNRSTLPVRDPDHIFVGGGSLVNATSQRQWEMHGLPGPGAGTGVGDVEWQNNLTAIVWTINAPFLTMNSTVMWSLNTSMRAPILTSGPPPYAKGKGPQMPSLDLPWGAGPYYNPAAIGDTLLIYHNGHGPSRVACVPNADGTVDYFNELGYDVMELDMPTYGCAHVPGLPTGHMQFQKWEKEGGNTMRFFIEPVALTVAYAKRLGYKHIVMAGFSGGGWTTHVAAAVLPEIDLSIAVAGSMPKWPTKGYPDFVPDLPEGHNPSAVSPDIFHPAPVAGAGGDYEQNQARPFFSTVGGYAQLYVLAALEPGRWQLQIVHEFDSCCFRAAGLFDGIKRYNSWAQDLAGGWFQTAVTAGNFHQFNLRDKVIVSVMIERLRRKGRLDKADFSLLPFDDLRVQ